MELKDYLKILVTNDGSDLYLTTDAPPAAKFQGVLKPIENIRLTKERLKAIADEVDLETVTNHELREIFFIVRKQMAHLNWKDLVTYSINHLPYGLNQTGIAWDGYKPCPDCPDAMIEGDHCYHKHACKAWEIFEAQLLQAFLQ